jgi:hypothetical protein
MLFLKVRIEIGLKNSFVCVPFKSTPTLDLHIWCLRAKDRTLVKRLTDFITSLVINFLLPEADISILR